MKKSIIYSDLSKKQLQHIKDFYIQKKVMGMSEKELREFVLDIVTNQIHDTIGKEEEMEAWKEMSDFFGNEFSEIIIKIQKKYQDIDKTINYEEDIQKNRIDLLEKNTINQEKKDMWDD